MWRKKMVGRPEVHTDNVVVSAADMVDAYVEALARIATCETIEEARATAHFLVATTPHFKSETRRKFKERKEAHATRRRVPATRVRRKPRTYVPY